MGTQGIPRRVVSDRDVYALLKVLVLPLTNTQNIILAGMPYFKKKTNQKTQPDSKVLRAAAGI